MLPRICKQQGLVIVPPNMVGEEDVGGEEVFRRIHQTMTKLTSSTGALVPPPIYSGPRKTPTGMTDVKKEGSTEENQGSFKAKFYNPRSSRIRLHIRGLYRPHAHSLLMSLTTISQ